MQFYSTVRVTNQDCSDEAFLFIRLKTLPETGKWAKVERSLVSGHKHYLIVSKSTDASEELIKLAVKRYINSLKLLPARTQHGQEVRKGRI